MERDPRTGLVGKVSLDIEVPPGFPAQYHDALVRAADQCAVKKHLEQPARVRRPDGRQVAGVQALASAPPRRLRVTATRGMPARSAQRSGDASRGSAATIARTPSAWPNPNSKSSQPPGFSRSGRLGHEAPDDVESVRAAVQGGHRLVVADLRLQ